MCTGREKLTAEGTEFEGQLQYVSDAVMAFANAFKYVSKYDPVTFYNVKFFFFFFFSLSLRFLLKKKKWNALVTEPSPQFHRYANSFRLTEKQTYTGANPSFKAPLGFRVELFVMIIEKRKSEWNC